MEEEKNIASSQNEDRPTESNLCRGKCAELKNMKPKTAVIIGCIIVLLALIFACRGLFVAATVNGSPISRLSVINELEKNSGKAALESLIVEKLINKEADKKSIEVSDDEINAEISKAEIQIKAQGGTLDEALASQGMTLEILKKQIAIQKKLEALLADKIQVTDAEITQFIADNKIDIPKGEEANYNAQIAQEIKQQKLNTESRILVDSLKASSSIRYFAGY